MSLLTVARRAHDWNRQRKWELFSERCLQDDDQTVLDVGFAAAALSDGYENTLEQAITDLSRVTGLSLDPIPEINPYPGMTMIQYSGGIFPFGNDEFDVCWSNAVLEHVGTDEKKIEFLSEIHRVAKSSFVTTPNRWFPIELHSRIPVLHYLPKPMFDRIARQVGKGWVTGSYMDLIGERRLKQLLAAAEIADYEIHKNKAGPFTIDFVVIF